VFDIGKDTNKFYKQKIFRKIFRNIFATIQIRVSERYAGQVTERGRKVPSKKAAPG
jgi:hypothetical protein